MTIFIDGSANAAVASSDATTSVVTTSGSNPRCANHPRTIASLLSIGSYVEPDFVSSDRYTSA